MKNVVLNTLVLVIVAGAAHAVPPAPVEDITTSGSINTRVARIERILKAKQSSDFATQQQLDALQQEVSKLRGLSEQQNYKIKQILNRQRQLLDDVANLSSEKKAVPVVQEPSTASGKSSLDETASYQNAVDLVLNDHQYNRAIPAFKKFIAQYPNSGYAANANYWLGQLLYNKGSYSEAKKAFNTVINKFKKSGKRADSLVKLGMIAEKSADVAKAKDYYRQVIKKYASSNAAKIAKKQLAKL